MQDTSDPVSNSALLSTPSNINQTYCLGSVNERINATFSLIGLTDVADRFPMY